MGRSKSYDGELIITTDSTLPLYSGAISFDRTIPNANTPAAMLKTSLTGKIRNLHHFKSEALLPLFEAVVNSIQAIEEAGSIGQGVITVRIKRDSSQTDFTFDNDDSLPPIIGFEIEDNGIGFNDKNYNNSRY